MTPPSIPEHIAVQLARHVDVAVRMRGRLLGDHERKDLAQDALAALVERVHAGRPVDDPRAWLVAVVRKLHALRCRTRCRDKAKFSLSDQRAMGDGATSEPACLPDSWAELDQLLAEVTPPYNEEEKADLRALAAGQTRQQIARERGETVDVVERRIKKSLERLRFFMGRGKCTGGET